MTKLITGRTQVLFTTSVSPLYPSEYNQLHYGKLKNTIVIKG
jgi:hypothetical protein